MPPAHAREYIRQPCMNTKDERRCKHAFRRQSACSMAARPKRQERAAAQRVAVTKKGASRTHGRARETRYRFRETFINKRSYMNADTPRRLSGAQGTTLTHTARKIPVSLTTLHFGLRPSFLESFDSCMCRCRCHLGAGACFQVPPATTHAQAERLSKAPA